MKPIETGMRVRLLVDDITNDHQKAGMIGRVVAKESNAGSPVNEPLFWVATAGKRADGLDIEHRAPYYAEDLEIVADAN